MTAREEVTVEEDGAVYEMRQPAVKGSCRVWIGGHERKERFGEWLQWGAQAILFDTALGTGTNLIVEYEVAT